MKAFVVCRYGRDGLRAADVPEPVPGRRDVLVRVMATSVNRADRRVRNGQFRQLFKHRRPFVLGHDVAGIVVGVGPAVRGIRVGDEVFGRPRDLRIGTFAELIAIDWQDVTRKPWNLSFEEAAAVPVVGLAAWQILVERAVIKPGQRVLIHGGAGGLGSTAIQLAKHLGATVATTTSPDTVQLVKELGADIVLDYTTVDFAVVLDDYDFVLDSLGESNVLKSLRVLRPGGLVVGVAGPPDPDFSDQLGRGATMRLLMGLLSLRVRRRAKRLGVRYEFAFVQASGLQLSRLTPLYEVGRLRPVIDTTFPFERTIEAMAHVENGRVRAGKVVVSMAPVASLAGLDSARVIAGIAS
jgi:NADPH:quinone reductase-like Zn-dependent oxidoreductase